MVFVFLLLLVASVQCGYPNTSSTFPEMESRIYKGYDVTIDQYPHATFLLFEATSPSSCGGSLISAQAVLTAGHCVDELRCKRGKMYAYFGATIPKKSTVVRQVIDYAINPSYNEKNGKNNIAVGYLKKQVPLQHAIKKIPLAVKGLGEDEIVFSVGWGKQQINRPFKLPDIAKSRSLKSTKQRVKASARKCSELAGFKVSGSVLCTVPEIGHFYTDDSGNGLVGKKPVMTLVGVFSFVSNGASIHTSVASFRDWIIKACRTLRDRNCK